MTHTFTVLRRAIRERWHDAVIMTKAVLEAKALREAVSQ